MTALKPETMVVAAGDGTEVAAVLAGGSEAVVGRFESVQEPGIFLQLKVKNTLSIFS